MKVEAIHPETGERYTVDMPSLDEEALNRMVEEHATDEQIKSYIEQLPVSAETKALLFKLSKYTITIGKTLFKIGKRILEIVVMLVSRYKMATFGLILGALLTFLIGLVPLIGPPLAAFLGPLLMLLGLGKGVWEDLKKDNPDLAASIAGAGDAFSPLQGATA